MGNECSKEPWRKPHTGLKWKPEFRKKLIEEMKTNAKRTSKKPCFLFVGPVSAGKSSVVNTCLSAGADDIVQKAECGTDEKSLTSKFTRYDAVDDLKNVFRLCDTSGILDDLDRGIRPKDIVRVIRGHVAPGYRFQDDKDISENDPKYVKVPTEQDKSHCLVIVLDSTQVDELPSEFLERVKNAITAARDEDIRTALLLTKIDKHCATVMEDKRTIFTCIHTKDVVAKTSELFGLPESKIFPVVNYSSQVSKAEAAPVDIIALLTLQRLLKLSYDYLEGNEFN